MFTIIKREERGRKKMEERGKEKKRENGERERERETSYFVLLFCCYLPRFQFTGP